MQYRLRLRPRPIMVMVDGVRVFYREAGPKNAPTILLLHGFPSSSRMFDPLFPLLSDKYHLAAPDYPGFGHSDAPPPNIFPYTFDHIAKVMDHFTLRMHLTHHALFMQDYGGPIGFRLALAHPQRVTAFIVQNAVSSEDGLGPLWATRRAFWKDRAANEGRIRRNLVSLDATRLRHVGTSPHLERYDPDTWTDEYAFLSRPGELQIQLDLFYDYRTNVKAYPQWQAYLCAKQPPLLVLWAKYDPSFAMAGAFAYKRYDRRTEVHILAAGHFALDEAPAQVAFLTRNFLNNKHFTVSPLQKDVQCH